MDVCLSCAHIFSGSALTFCEKNYYCCCFIFLQGDETSVVDCRKCEAAARIVIDCCQSRSAYEHHFRALAPQVEWHYC